MTTTDSDRIAAIRALAAAGLDVASIAAAMQGSARAVAYLVRQHGIRVAA